MGQLYILCAMTTALHRISLNAKELGMKHIWKTPHLYCIQLCPVFLLTRDKMQEKFNENVPAHTFSGIPVKPVLIFKTENVGYHARIQLQLLRMEANSQQYIFYLTIRRMKYSVFKKKFQNWIYTAFDMGIFKTIKCCDSLVVYQHHRL